MGAYYKAVIDNSYSVNPHNHDNGYKLMEHSYLDNNYCMSVEQKMTSASRTLVWLCDYHEKDEVYQFKWEDFKDRDINDDNVAHDRFFVNHSKELYIDTAMLRKLSEEIDNNWVIHPLPILCNSEKQSAGGGDYRKDDSRRAIWCNDEIQVVLSKEDILSNYKDVTTDCLFKE
jgi:hypothetical protein